MMHPFLRIRLQRVVDRRRRFHLSCKLASCWAVAALLGLGLIALQRQSGWASSLSLPVIAALGLIAAIVVALRHRKTEPDWRRLAGEIEARHPDLDGLLLTAVEQEAKPGNELNYLQERLVQEAIRHDQRKDWSEVIPQSRLTTARVAHLLALVLFGFVLLGLHTTGGHKLLARVAEKTGITVTPGDVSIERGNSLVVLARFGGALPLTVDLVLGNSSDDTRRIPLVKSLADPMFGGSVPEVTSNLVYHVEYAGQKTREFKVTVFEHPRLERSDADLTYPEYTGQEPKHIKDTRRLSAVEGSHLDLTLQLNKPVVSARLVAKDNDKNVIPLVVGTNRAVAELKQLPLTESQTYQLQLVDEENRTNKVPAQFVFSVLKNRAPELKLASPRGDVRPSALEEISFEGTVWDDFGVQAYGLAYSLVGQELQFIELGSTVAAKEKRNFQRLLRLEDLGLETDQLMSWFLWADDIGPDGQPRRTTGDMYFAEVRPFEEIFREGQGMEGQSGEQQGGQQGNRTAKLAELQKQIINATWKLQREHAGSSSRPADRVVPAPRKSGNSSPPTSDSRSGDFPYRFVAQVSKPAVSRVSKPADDTSAEGLPTWKSATQQVWKPALQRPLLQFAGQRAPDNSPPTPSSKTGRTARERTPSQSSPSDYKTDAVVVLDSQAQALEQAEATAERQQDPRTAALWATAMKEMEKAVEKLQAATNSPAKLAEALAAEQAAYQALLKLQQHEYQVTRQRNQRQQGGGGSSREQQMQRQLDQMDLTQEENRYETQRQAQSPQNAERQEQLQVMNRLQELARRQQDLNERLKELQTALQEAKTEAEREEIRRRLKRLQEEEQQMLADVDELRQRMDRPENQSRMAEERKQLEQTREDVQRAAEAASQGSPSQALASGTRAQRQLQEMRDQMREKNSSQFSDDMREMRAEARELARQQEDILQKMQDENRSGRKSLSDSDGRKEAIEQLAQQKQRLTNLVERATQVSQEAETAEPLLSRQLYDTVRKFSQDSGKAVKDAQDDLLNRGLMTRGLYERLKDESEQDGAKLMDVTSELLREDFMPLARETGQRQRASINDLKRGVERAAESVLGDDTEALRLAQQELDQLTDQLQREIAQAEGGSGGTNRLLGWEVEGNREQGTNRLASAGGRQGTNDLASASGRQGRQGQGQEANQRSGETAQADGQNQQGGERSEGQQNSGQQGTPQQSQGEQASSGQQGQRSAEANQQGEGQQPGQSPSGQGRQGEQAQSGQAGQGGRTARDGAQRGGARDGRQNRGGDDRGGYGGGAWDFDRILNPDTGRIAGPVITGDDFAPWAERLRDVEEMIDLPDLRNDVAAARERVRLMRQEFKRDAKKPDWAVVRLQVIKPLVEVRDRIAEELARRQSTDSLVPIDRDPVPNRYSELVRRYYEELGKDK